MAGNLLIFVVLLAVTIGLGYLTYRAIRAKKVWVKVVGGAAAGLGTLIFGAITLLGGLGMTKAYGQVNPPVPANVKVEGTPAQIARGQYIANIVCASCHSGTGDYRLPFTGGADIAKDIPIPIGSMIVSNIAPDGQIKDYTDAELFRAIRHGVRRDGVPLAVMSTLATREISDDDVKAIIAYLRSLPPASSTARGGDNLNFLAAVLAGAGMLPTFTPSAETISAPPQGVTPAYGKYVATFGDCRACHGTNMTGTPPSMIGPGAPNPRPFVSTLTLDQFRQMMRTGVRPNGTPLLMPWQNAARLSDDDLAAVHAYLTAQP